MKCTVTYTQDLAALEFDSIQSAATALLAEFPDGVIYDAGGFDRDEDDSDASYDIRSGRAALVWASAEESTDDGGSRAVAEITVGR
jgi:hypothetical protein